MRLINSLFAVSKVCAAVAGAFLLSGALASPFLAAVYGRTEHTQLGAIELTFCFLALFVAGIGLIRIYLRGAEGLIFASAPALVLLVHGRFLQASVFEAILLAVFGLPFLLAFFESRRHASNQSLN